MPMDGPWPSRGGPRGIGRKPPIPPPARTGTWCRATGALCVEVVTVSVSRRGQLRLERVDVVFDEGFSLVNPLSVRKQIEGQIAWGFSDTMWQEITVKDGRVAEGNFDEYQIARMADYPLEVNIQFLKTNNKWIS